MDITLSLRPSKTKSQSIMQPMKETITFHLHEPDTTQECPILQEPIKSTTGLDWFPRPFCAQHPKYSAITLQCKHTYHAMALVYNWARNRHVLCPVCRAGPRNQQLVVSKLPRNWRYSLATRLRREWKNDKNKSEEEDRQTALAMAAASQEQQPVIRFTVLMMIESVDTIISWMGRAVPVPGVGALIFHIPIAEIRTIPFVRGDRIRIRPILHVSPTNFISHLIPTCCFELGGTDDPGYAYSILFDELHPTKISHLLYAVNEEIFTRTLALSLMHMAE